MHISVSAVTVFITYTLSWHHDLHFYELDCATEDSTIVSLSILQYVVFIIVLIMTN